MTLPTLSPADTRTAINAGARLIDIRGTDEHARERIPGAINERNFLQARVSNRCTNW